MEELSAPCQGAVRMLTQAKVSRTCTTFKRFPFKHDAASVIL